VFIGVAFNLLILAYFKYSYFATELINSWFSTSFEVVDYLAVWANALNGSHFDVTTIILPIGISFYTFQSISYLVDIYRNKIPAIKNYIDLGLYITFFPALVAGPIVRAEQFTPQLRGYYQLSRNDFSKALFMIICGLIKKIIVADYISLNFVDRVFDTPQIYSGFENLMAVYGYSLQIYCDFSGYTDIAIGIAMLLGFRLPANFNSPYKAANITDFWRRWHISLSSWLRDYLYIPIGGNRHGTFVMCFALIITMLLGGLWHGANTKFLIWGAMHGVALMLHKLWTMYFVKKHKIIDKNFGYYIRHFLSVFICFNFVCFCWIFFRADNMQAGFSIINQITNHFGLQEILPIITNYWLVFSIIIITFIIHLLPKKFKENINYLFYKIPIPIKLLIAIFVALLLYQSQSLGLQPFVYFQF
jgi:D-alanyl-lipoteichoic acid acyltransferase DltB (MBOAT superfamily)